MIALADRQGRTMCLALMDLDHFKKTNDTHGHAAGDEALRTFVAVCRAECRATDVLARFGGEEFVLLLPDAGADEARAVVERIRANLAGRTMWHAGASFTITVSAGVSERAPGENLETLVRRADAALYAAKDAGRDRVEVG
jgi:diguanylate cyclase (GGDEF)-like protein